MKKRIMAALAASVVSVFLLAGCATTGSGPAAPKTVDLSNPDAVAALCGDNANDVYEFVLNASEAKATSGQRNVLATRWGLDKDTVSDDEKLAAVVASLKSRAETPCEDVAAGADQVGVENADGTVAQLPLVSGTGDTIVIDTTNMAATPPLLQPALLDGSLQFTAQTLTWAGLVERVGDQQWYIDGVNARAAQTGFTWDDVLKFASVNKMVDGKVQGVNSLAIQVFNLPNLTDEQVRNEVRKYITPEVEKTMGLTVNDLQIQRINSGFINTRNVGTKAYPQMGEYFDTQHMVRVSMMPITFDDKGTAIGLDGSRGSGVFIDCGNLHWVPKAVWHCTENCEKPKCPPGTTGTPPNCVTPPPEVCPPGTTGTPPNCLQSKGDRTPDNGWTPIDLGPLTNGQLTQEQRDNGDVSGQPTDNPVAPGTQTGDTTPELPTDTNDQAPGATPGGDDRADDPVDEENTNQDPGGTQGDTCIVNPLTGANECG